MDIGLDLILGVCLPSNHLWTLWKEFKRSRTQIIRTPNLIRWTRMLG